MSSRWACRSLDVLACLLVLALGQWVDRADLGAAALEPLEPAVDLASLLLRAAALGGRRPPRRGARRSPPAPLRPPRAAIAEVGRLDLGLGQLVGGRLHLGLQLELALRAGAHLLGDLIPVALIAQHRALGPLDPGPDRSARGLDRSGGGAELLQQFLGARKPPPAGPRDGARRAGPRRRRAWRSARSAPLRTAPSAASRSGSGACDQTGPPKRLAGLGQSRR